MILKEGAKCEKIARTGRVESWLASPESRLAVSCTTFVVEDSMEGPEGIEASWRFVSHALRNAAGAAIHLSKLRPKGEDNGKGLIASGPVSFAKIYSKLNEVLRRGGTFRNGAVTLHLDYDHPDAFEFVTASRAELPWAKRCLNVDQHFLDNASPELLAACLKAISSGDLWMMKMKTDPKGARIYGNVCVAGDTLVNTAGGIMIPIKDLIGKPFTAVVNGKEYKSSDRGAWSNGVKSVWTIRLENGQSLTATPCHKIAVEVDDNVTDFIPLSQLHLGDWVCCDDGHPVTKGLNSSKSRLVSIMKNFEEIEVFDCSIPGLGAFSGNGIIVSNCLEVLLPHRGTCLLQHINLGACSIEDIDLAFVEGMVQLCELHPHTGVGNTGEYLSPDNDKQVGLGMLGLANFLAIHKISYKDFGEALDACLMEDPHPWCHYWCDQPAGKAVAAIAKGITDAAAVARAHGMERAFCIAPTASCSYRYLDTLGFTTAPEIAPPIGRIVDRDSGTFGVEQFNYGNVEIAAEVGWPTFFKVANGIVKLFQNTGLMHGYSCNHWSDQVVYSREFLQNWLESPQTSLYYALQVTPQTQRKDDAYAALDDDFKEMFGLDNDEAIEDAAVCNLDAGFCSSCAE